MTDLGQAPVAAPGAPARQALLAQLRRAQRGVAEPGGIPRRPAGLGEVPLSFGQEQLWFLEQLAPESAAYNVPVVLRLRGRLERAALQRALDALVARHEALRTSFAAVGGSPVQVVADPSPLPLAFSDLEPLGRERAEAELSRLVALDVSRPLRLEPSPPLRSRLVRLGESLHVLVVTIHHVIFDGWSLEVFLRELAALYEQEVARRPCGLPELAVQYADYALWQRDRLQGDRLERLESRHR